MDDRDDHAFSDGEGFDSPYEAFDIDPPVLSVDPDEVDPVDARVIPDLLDESAIGAEAVDAEALLDVGVEYMRINRFEQAADAFERAARFATDAATEQEAWTNKGVAHAQLEEYDEAIGAYREALVFEDTTDFLAEAETNLAYALWETGRDELALEHAERAVERDPHLPQAWFNRAFLAAERGLLEDAKLALENAERLGLRERQVLELKVEVLEELGEHEAAERALERAERQRDRQERELVE
ncbi:MAG: tetratricopeptide repeat protein [Halobacteriales archaeon]